MTVNWCLVAVAFALGFLLTLAFMVRRVKREVPVYASAGGGATAATLTGSAGVKASAGAASAPKVAAEPDAGLDKPTAVIRTADADLDKPTAVIKTVDVEDSVDTDAEPEAPYGVGSVRLVGGAAPPSGWEIKGNEDSMLYHTADSPSYKQTIAEIWFQDEDTARGAGFRNWKEGRSASGATKVAAFADVEPELPDGPHGPGTAAPNADGSGPAGWDVKGNEDSMLYHTTESPYYGRTIAEVWFRDVATAEAAGFNRWDSGKSQRDKK
jgi:hypothetical protein